MALTVSLVSPPMQFLVELPDISKAPHSLFYYYGYAFVPCNAFLSDIFATSAFCDLRTYNSMIPS